ncbi:hypothetical protein L9F63_019974, partial [Diploptera punctata]
EMGPDPFCTFGGSIFDMLEETPRVLCRRFTFPDVSPETASGILKDGETSGNYKLHDHDLQPENLLQDHHSNSGRESLREYNKIFMLLQVIFK